MILSKAMGQGHCHTRRLASAIAALGVALVLTGSPVSNAANKPSASSTKSPLLIALPCSCTGALAAEDYYVRGVGLAWQDYENSLGGIDGHKVEALVADDATNPTTSVTEMKHLITSVHVVAIIDQSEFDALWAKTAIANNVPIIGVGSSGSLVISSTPDAFPSGETADIIPDSIAYAVKRLHFTKLAEFYCVEASSCAENSAKMGAAATAYGLKDVYTTAISSSQPTYTAECIAAKDAGAQALLVYEALTSLIAVGQDCAQQGYYPVQLGESNTAASLLKAPGLNGAYFAETNIPYVVKNSPGLATMYSALNRYSPSVVKNPDFSDEAVGEWAALQEVAAAARAGHLGNTPTAAEIKNGLYSFKNQTLGGLSGPLTFHRGQDNTSHCFFEMRIEQGQFVAPIGGRPICLANPPVLVPKVKV